MACRTIVTEGADGKRVAIIVCGPRGRAPRACSYCTRPHTKRCDFIIGIARGDTSNTPQTCDAPLCGQCAEKVGPDKDHCRVHKLRGDKEAVP